MKTCTRKLVLENSIKKVISVIISSLLLCTSFGSVTLGAVTNDEKLLSTALNNNVLATIDSNKGVPSERQYNYQRMETVAFIHFGMNTFTDREWGDGTESPSLFNPTNLDARQWVQTLKDAGFKEVILTAKHHDGFCLWPSAYTEHSVKNSPWKDGKGDVVKEVSDACHELGVKFGVYLSPWDQNSPHYGQGKAYNDYYVNQLTELLTNYGEISEVWMDGAKGSNVTQDYDRERWENTIRTLQPNAIIWSDAGPDARWSGNEQGIAGDPMWSTVDISKMANPTNDKNYLSHGEAGGPDWMTAECDVSIRPGWFYHANQDSSIKSLEKLLDIYYKSVGRNSVLLLNVPPDKRGLFTDKDIARLREYKKALDDTFDTDFAVNSTITASSGQGAENLTDNDDTTFWSTNAGTNTGSLTVDFGRETNFDVINIQEYIRHGQNVSRFNVEAWYNNSWNEIAAATTIGSKRLIRMAPITASKIRINILESLSEPVISTVGVYKQPDEISQPAIPVWATIVNDFNIGTGINQFQYFGSWGTNTNTDGPYNKDAHWTSDMTASYKVKFIGTEISIYGTKDPNHGIVSVSIDDGAPVDVDSYGADRKDQVLLYKSPYLSSGEHTLTVKATGRKNALSGRPDIHVDFAAISNKIKGSFEFTNSSYDVKDTNKTVEITVKRTMNTEERAEIDYATFDGTAKAGTDYQAWSGTLAFNAGETTKSFFINIMTDSSNKTDRSFSIGLSNPTSNAVVGVQSTAAVTIKEVTIEESDLGAVINAAEDKLSKAVIGEAEGQYPKRAKYALSAAINVAKVVRDNAASTQVAVDSVVKALNRAVETFNASVITK